MSNIIDEKGHKVATIGEDMVVHNLAGDNIGHVTDTNEVFNRENSKVGHFQESDGYVFNYNNDHIGTIRAGKAWDLQDHWVGGVQGDHVYSGGAALLLLVR